MYALANARRAIGPTQRGSGYRVAEYRNTSTDCVLDCSMRQSGVFVRISVGVQASFGRLYVPQVKQFLCFIDIVTKLDC
jgi:hypothetical protein